jgi:hypothetical protein
MVYALGKSKVVSASTTIIATAARILGVGIKAGTDSASVKLLDGGASGTQKTVTMAVGTGVSDHWSFPDAIQCSTDIYATISGTAPEVAVEYED